MSVKTHTLTDIEEACGVTLEQVADLLPQVVVRENGNVWLPLDTAPALASSTARCAVGGPVDFVSSRFGVIVYAPA